MSFQKDCHRPRNQLTLPVSDGFSFSPPSSSIQGRHELDISNFSRVTPSPSLHYMVGFLTPVAEKKTFTPVLAHLHASIGSSFKACYFK